MTDITHMRRYTTFPALLYMLQNKSITLLDPESWDDSNDTHYLAKYKKSKSLTNVLALCFTNKPETYHHWHVFAGKSGGVCLTFKRDELLSAVGSVGGVRHGEVQYRTIKELRAHKPTLEELPFLKRYGFQDEQEYRIIYEGNGKEKKAIDLKIPLECIQHIHIDPWINPALFKTLRQTVLAIDGCSSLKVSHSSLVGNNEWKKIADGAA